MKTFMRYIAVVLFMAGAGSAFAVPLSPSFTARVSIALPTQQFDFSDLDLRDEFNRPVVAPIVRERFEQQLTKELNRLLIQNMTPLRRAWLDLLDAAENASGDWFENIYRRATHSIGAFLRDNPIYFQLIQQRLNVSPPVASRLGATEESGALFLVMQLISSTRLLR